MFRQRSGHRYRRQFGSRIWQEGYYDRVLREEDDTLEIARYIAANPVRAGLCQDAREYPYLGSSCYSLDVLVSRSPERLALRCWTTGRWPERLTASHVNTACCANRYETAPD